MLAVTTTTHKIEVLLDGAVNTNQLDCYVNYKIVTTTSITPTTTLIRTNGASAVTLVPSVSDSAYRHVVDFISVHNADYANATVTIRYNGDVGGNFILVKILLQSRQTLLYQDGKGFSILDRAGLEVTNKLRHTAQANGGLYTGLSKTLLSADSVNNNATANTLQACGNLNISCTAGKLYYFRFVIAYNTAATATGSRFTLASSLSAAGLTYRSEYLASSSTTARNPQLNAFQSPATCSANSNNVNGANFCYVEGFIAADITTTLALNFASEVSSSAVTAKIGSYVLYKEY